MQLTVEINNVWGLVANILLLVAGLFFIIKGGDMFVDGSVDIARRFKIPELIIGATIVSVGTTLPELITSATSVIKGLASGDAVLAEGYNSIAVGNSVGSMMCNTGLILGIVLMMKPTQRQGKEFLIKALYLLVLSAVLCIMCYTGSSVSVLEGVILLVFFVVFITINLYEATKCEDKANLLSMHKDKEMYSCNSGNISAQNAGLTNTDAKNCNTNRCCQVSDKKSRLSKKSIAFFILGAVFIALGAMLLVDNTQNLCIAIGVPQQIAGITVVAIGTSLPELVTSLTSLKKGNGDIGTGNIIGANIINASLLLGFISVITGSSLGIDKITHDVAIWAMLAIQATLVLPSLIFKKTYKWQGATMFAIYIAFIVYNIVAIL